MTKERDQFLKYVDFLENSKWRCKFCRHEFAGRTSRILPHLAGIPRQNVRLCGEVHHQVREEAFRVFNICTGGTSGTGTEGTVSGASQSVAPSEGVSNPNDVQNSNRPGCVRQQPSFYPPTGAGTAPAGPQDEDASNPNHTQNSNQLGCTPQQPSFYQPTGTGTAPACPQDDDASNSNHTQNSNRLGCMLQQPSFYQPTGTGTAPACPQDQVPLPPGDMPLDNLDNTQRSNPSRLDSSHGNEIASPLQQLPIDCLDLFPLDQSELSWGHLEFGGGITQETPLYPTENFDMEEIFFKSCEEGANTSEELETDELHNPTPMDRDPSTASQQLEASTNTIGQSSAHASAPPQLQIVPHGCINLTTMHQNPTLASSSSKKQLVTCHTQALMDKDSCMPSSSQAPNNAPPPPQILPLGTGLIGPASIPELDTNEGAPMMSHPNTRNNCEENGALKRKLGEVNKLLEHLMVGEAFQKNTTKILDYLVGNQISRLGICGMGGVGKTTIMSHVHNRLLEEANYGDVLWITVSRDFKTRKLQGDIWKALGLGKLEEKDVRIRAAMLCNRLTKKGKFTIILDDVWECIDLTEVGILVKVDGMKLVLTTQFIDICHQMQCKMIKIEPLSNIEAKNLFLDKLGSEVALNLETEEVVMSVIKECAGLPLAIVTIARSMRGVTNTFEWKDCSEKLKESNIGKTDVEKVLKRLKFSYNRLGDHEYQQCFLSCALYPEGLLIDKFELIEFFIDQGLIGLLDTREKQYDSGLTILQKLVNACLLEDHKSMVKMHDLIRHMALHVMSVTSLVKAGKGLWRIPFEEYWTDGLEKVSLMKNDIKEFPLNMSPNCPKLSTFLLNESSWFDFMSPNCPKLSTFLLNGSSWFDFVIPDCFFKHLWGLKILNLSGCTLRELPNSISDLVNLTALLLRECYLLCRIPHLGKLRSLRKLDIFNCVGVEALEGLEMLVNLRYLDIAHTSIQLPKGTLGALLNLQCLVAGLVNGEEITKLLALETLNCSFDDVDDFNKFVRVVSKQGNNPRYYKISVPQEGWDSVDQTNVGALFQYRERSVNIERSHAIVSARGESSGSGSGICILIPQDVRNLRVWNCDSTTNLSNMGPLEELEELEIKHWSNLRVLCGGQDEEVINIHDSPTRTSTPLLFISLRDLEISECPKLKYLFGHEPKFSLPHLQRIRITYCREMVGITVAATSPPPYPPPAFPSLEEIKVERCGKMKRVVESEWLSHFPNLRRLSVFYSKNMEEIIGGLSSYMSVEEISPERLLGEGFHESPLHLQNLQNIQVIGCEGMAEMISGVGQGEEGSMTTPINNTPSSSQSSISLPKLNYLCLYNLPQLKSICESSQSSISLPKLNYLCLYNLPQLNSICEVPITCNSMEYLEVYGCPKLNRIPLELQFHDIEDLPPQFQFHDIEDLPHIVVEGEEKWKTIWDHPNAQVATTNADAAAAAVANFTAFADRAAAAAVAAIAAAAAAAAAAVAAPADPAVAAAATDAAVAANVAIAASATFAKFTAAAIADITASNDVSFTLAASLSTLTILDSAQAEARR